MGYYKIWSAKTIDGEKNNHGYSQIKFDHYLILIHMYNVDIRHHINLISWCYNEYFGISKSVSVFSTGISVNHGHFGNSM